MSLLDDVKEGSRRSRRGPGTSVREKMPAGMVGTLPEYLDFSRMMPRWGYYASGVGIAVLFLAVLFMFRPEADEQEVEGVQTDVPQIVLKEVQPFDAASKKQSPEEPAEKVQVQIRKAEQESPPLKAAEPATVVKKGVEKKEPPVQAPKAESEGGAPVPEIAPAAQNKMEKKPEQQVAEAAATQKETALMSIVDDSAERVDVVFTELVAQSEEKDTPDDAGLAEKEVEAETEVKQVVEKDAGEQKKEDSPKFSAIQTVKLSQPPEPVKILKEGTKRKPEELPTLAVAGLAQAGEDDSTVLFRERLAAGARWLVGAGEKYTVQLMVLTSENAEQNLVNMLKKKEYRDIADQLYVLRRIGAISTVMVFYGEYPTLTAARNARNNLPVFLRKHHPYAISVHGAVTKAQTAD